MDARTRMLKATVSKLFRRGAEGNIRRILMRTHTADVASLLENLSTEERIAVFSHISSIDQKAEVISYLKESTQVEILSILTNPEVQEIVSRMDRDDAADLLRRLPEESSKSILNAMVKVDSEEVEELMGYPEGTAGALMSSELIALDENLTASEAIAAIQREDDDHVAFYIYVTNKRDQLVGVLSLKQLILSRPQQVLRDIMSTDVISVQLTTPHTEVAHVVEKYDFLSVPVVDQEHKLVGVITVDDVIDVIREEATEDFLAMGRAGWSGELGLWHHLRARSPWVGLAFGTGLGCFALIYFFLRLAMPDLTPPDARLGYWIEILAFLPLLLFVSSTLAQQSTTFTVEGLRSGHLTSRLGRHLSTEIGFAVVMALILGGVLFLIVSQWLPLVVGLYLILALAFQVLLSVLLGTVTPLLIKKLGMDPAVSALPFLTAIADICAVGVLLWVLVMSGRG